MPTIDARPVGDAAEIGAGTRLECKICWYVYDPARGRRRLADSAGHAVRASCRRTGPARTARRRRTSSWCCAMTDARAPPARPVARGSRRRFARSRGADGGAGVRQSGARGRGGRLRAVGGPLAGRDGDAVVHEPRCCAARSARVAAARRRARSGATRFPPATTNSSARTTTRSASTRSARCSRRCSNSPTMRRRGSSRSSRARRCSTRRTRRRRDMPVATSRRRGRRRARAARAARGEPRRAACRSATSCAAASPGDDR